MEVLEVIIENYNLCDNTESGRIMGVEQGKLSVENWCFQTS